LHELKQNKNYSKKVRTPVHTRQETIGNVRHENKVDGYEYGFFFVLDKNIILY